MERREWKSALFGSTNTGVWLRSEFLVCRQERGMTGKMIRGLGRGLSCDNMTVALWGMNPVVKHIENWIIFQLWQTQLPFCLTVDR